MRPANPPIGSRIECSFFRFFELIDILGKFPRVSTGASLLTFSLFLRSHLNFHGVGTALMRTFDLYFIQRWTFASSDVSLTQHSSCEPYSSNWSQNFCVLPRNRCRFWQLSVVWYATQLSHTFRNSYCTFVTTLLRPFVGLFLNFLVQKWALCTEFRCRFRLKELTFGRMPQVTR